MQIERYKKEADEAEAKGDALGFTRMVSSSNQHTAAAPAPSSSAGT
jgi:hypothetical protein